MLAFQIGIARERENLAKRVYHRYRDKVFSKYFGKDVRHDKDNNERLQWCHGKNDHGPCGEG